jgi:hypothetical protein
MTNMNKSRSHFSANSSEYRNYVEEGRSEKEVFWKGGELVAKMSKSNFSPEDSELYKNILTDLETWFSANIDNKLDNSRLKLDSRIYLSRLIDFDQDLKKIVDSIDKQIDVENTNAIDILKEIFSNENIKTPSKLVKNLLEANERYKKEYREYVNNEFSDFFDKKIRKLYKNSLISEKQLSQVRERVDQVNFQINSVLEYNVGDSNNFQRYSRKLDSILVLLGRYPLSEAEDKELEFQKLITHEMLHAVSGAALTKRKNRETSQARPMQGKHAGLIFLSKGTKPYNEPSTKEVIGRYMDEGLTEYLTKKFIGEDDFKKCFTDYNSCVAVVESFMERIPEDKLIAAYFESLNESSGDGEHRLPETKTLFNSLRDEFSHDNLFLVFNELENLFRMDFFKDKKDASEFINILDSLSTLEKIKEDDKIQFISNLIDSISIFISSNYYSENYSDKDMQVLEDRVSEISTFGENKKLKKIKNFLIKRVLEKNELPFRVREFLKDL